MPQEAATQVITRRGGSAAERGADPPRVLAGLFPPDPTPRGHVLRRMAGYLLFLAAGTALTLLSSHRKLPRRVWGEDGSRVLTDAYAHPPGVSQLFEPFHGYFNLYPRLSGVLAAAFPVRDAGIVLAASAAMVTATVALLVWRASASHLRSAVLRGALALATLVLPITAYEMLANSVNVHWWLLWGALWALLWRPRGWPGRIAAAVVALLAALSDPLCVVLLPIVVLRVIALRNWRDHLVSVALAGGSLCQVGLQIADPYTAERGATPTVVDAAPTYGLRVALGAITGVLKTEQIWGTHPQLGLIFAGLLVAALLAYPAVRRGSSGLLVLSFVLASAALFAAPLVLRGGQIPVARIGKPAGLWYAGRYSWLPQLTLLAGLFVAVDRLWPTPRAAAGTAEAVRLDPTGPAAAEREDAATLSSAVQAASGGQGPTEPAGPTRLAVPTGPTGHARPAWPRRWLAPAIPIAVAAGLLGVWAYDGWHARGPDSHLDIRLWRANIGVATRACRAQPRLMVVRVPVDPAGSTFKARVPCARLR